MDAWHTFKWVWAAVLLVYIVIQIVALRRLDGDQKKVALRVLIAIVVLETVSSYVRDVFEVAAASRVGMVVVGLAAAAAIAILSRMLIRASGQQGLLKAESLVLKRE